MRLRIEVQGVVQGVGFRPAVYRLATARGLVGSVWNHAQGVTIDAQGTTLFTRDYQQHLANIELAKHNGVLDSAR